ncbi:prostate and testis expressed protein 1 [Cynocephalus volans]|uniref:prostate and testis expressed protein 1 n=1 Tax=Cynocephalus volans TaxID=110931 RepID=UPI002FC7A4F6
MDKFLLLELHILLCCFRVLSGSFSDRDNAAQLMKFPGEKCYKGRGTCIATTEEACAVGRIFKKDGTPWLTFLGCVKNCADVRNMRWSVYLVNFSCCRSSDLCNEKL